MTPASDKLLHITDLHFWEIVANPLQLLNKRFLGNINVIYRRRHEFAMEMAAFFGEHLATLGYEDLLIGGDFTSTATHREFEMGRRHVAELEELGFNIHLIPGNHDVYTFESVRNERFREYFGHYESAVKLPHRITLRGGTPLILVPTVSANWLSSAGYIRDEEAHEARALIDECPDGPILVAGHYPMLHETHAYRSGPSRQLRNAEALRRALGESGRQILYVAGHVHRFSYTQDADYPGLQHMTTGAYFLRRPGEAEGGAFSTIQVHPDGFHIEWHQYTESWTAKQATAQAVPR